MIPPAPAMPVGAAKDRQDGRDYVTDSKTMTFPVDASHIMMFARSLGDQSFEYYEGEEPTGRGLVAPPTFPQAVAQFNPDYHLRPKPDEPWFGSGGSPSGIEGKPASSGNLHAEQHFEFVRPVRAGDVLSVTIRDGDTWEKESKRAGLLKFTERVVEYRDQDGELVCIARSVGVKTERPVDQG